MSLVFSTQAEAALQSAHRLHATTKAYERLVSTLRAIESDTNLIANEAVQLMQFTQPTFLLALEIPPPGPTRVSVVFSVADDGQIVVVHIGFS